MRQGVVAKHDGLAKLRMLESLFQFGLAGKNNLRELFGGGLEIGEQAG